MDLSVHPACIALWLAERRETPPPRTCRSVRGQERFHTPRPPHPSRPFPPAFNREANWLLQARYVAYEYAFRDVTAVSRSRDTELKNIYTPGGPRRQNTYEERAQTKGVYGSTERRETRGARQEGRSSKSNRHRTQKWRSTTQPATASTKRPAMPGARCTGTADPAPRVEEGAKEACLVDWHSRQGGSLYSRLAFFSWPAWPDSAPDFSRWSGSRASSTSLIHGKLANVCQVHSLLTAACGDNERQRLMSKTLQGVLLKKY